MPAVHNCTASLLPLPSVTAVLIDATESSKTSAYFHREAKLEVPLPLSIFLFFCSGKEYNVEWLSLLVLCHSP